MREEKIWIAVLVVLVIAVVASLTFTVSEATKCADKGGVYLTGKGVWPVCLKAETL